MNKQIIPENSKDTHDGGRKFDYGKTLYSLLSPFFLKMVADVLTYGCLKYERDNWLNVPNAKERYKDALLRHIYSYLSGEQIDPETGFHHLAHATCNIMFLFEFDRLELNP